jgi:SAM-dependent methyltransferase
LWLYRIATPLLNRPIKALLEYPRFFLDRWRFHRAGGKARMVDLFPCLFDRTSTTGFDPHYFYQAAWAMQQLASKTPQQHVDVGSDLRFVGMLSALTRVTFIDIRPADIELPGFDSRAGSLLEMPYENNSVESLSCLHVIEHIGLGRYGDPIDPEGANKAFKELQRVLSPGGHLYLSTPVGRSRVQYNGQRVFAVDEVIHALNELRLVQMACVDGMGRYHADVKPGITCAEQSLGLDFNLAMFMFSKPETDE